MSFSTRYIQGVSTMARSHNTSPDGRYILRVSRKKKSLANGAALAAVCGIALGIVSCKDDGGYLIYENERGERTTYSVDEILEPYE